MPALDAAPVIVARHLLTMATAGQYATGKAEVRRGCFAYNPSEQELVTQHEQPFAAPVTQHDRDLAPHPVHFESALDVIRRHAVVDLALGDLDRVFLVPSKQGYGDLAWRRELMVNWHEVLK